MAEPRVWSRNEVIDLITNEIQETRKDFQRRSVPFDAREVAEVIYATLDDNYLIELEP